MEINLLPPDVLASVALRSLLLLLLTAGAGFVLRRRSAAMQHGVWAMGLGGCLAMPIVAALSPSWSLPLLPAGLSNPTTRADEAADREPIPGTTALAPTINGDGSLIGFAPPTSPRPIETLQDSPSTERGSMEPTTPIAAATAPIERISLGSVGSAIWACGFFLVLARLVQQVVAVKSKLRPARDLDSAPWRAQRDAAAERLGVRANVALKQHSGALSPLVVGVRKPVVVLPADADAWSDERRMLVLLHELAHVKRRDVLTQTIACLACAVHWFNPICWYGLARMRTLREMACDDLVLMSGQPATDYADVLLDVARTYRHRGFSTAVGMAHTTNVESRILAILDQARTRASLTRRVIRAFLLAATALVLVIGSLRLQSRAAPPAASDESAVDAEAEVEKEAEKADENFRVMEVQISDEAGKPLEGAKLYVGVWYVDGYQGEKVPKQHFADARG
ncbi:MAG TPA: M56 family metallopeptidase, partial [Lacipirellula sp.]